jgi:hypothetical protein
MRFTRWRVGLWFKRLGIVMFVWLPAQYMWSRQQPPGAVPPWGYVWLLVGVRGTQYQTRLRFSTVSPECPGWSSWACDKQHHGRSKSKAPPPRESVVSQTARPSVVTRMVPDVPVLSTGTPSPAIWGKVYGMRSSVLTTTNWSSGDTIPHPASLQY